ncbi:hypothetical protein [Novacetimonas pomaceti]|uniref:hypothetical protein n=1 Tax=Novacetimonas pomaceti TaxID=2021998 RepID=UPI001EEFAF2B|nr:hypothetical protein [Novacetimonas pomaceti]
MSEPHSPDSAHGIQHEGIHHETRDVSLRAVIVGGVGIGLAVGGLVMLADVLFPQGSLDRLLRPPFPVMSRPALQSDPAADMSAFAARDMAALNGFGWTDPARGIGHIPIGQAMEQVAREGIPDWPAKGGTGP